MESLHIHSHRHSLTDVNQDGKSAKAAVKRAPAVFAEYEEHAAARRSSEPAEV